MIRFTRANEFGCVAFCRRIFVLTPNKQGKKLGRGGIDLTPSEERSAPEPPPEHQDSPAEGRHRGLEQVETSRKSKKGIGNPAWRTKEESLALTGGASTVQVAELLPRETGHDIGLGSPVPLSQEAVGIITRLRNQKAGKGRF